MTPAATIAAQIRELQTMPATQLAECYAELFGKPPRIRNLAWLRRQVAWRLQERAFGGLSPHAKTRLAELVAQVELPIGQLPPPRPPRPAAARADANAPMVGTVITREWRGQQLRVHVRENGYEWDNTLFKSLSAVARAITGTNWNGRLFFKLVERRKAT